MARIYIYSPSGAVRDRAAFQRGVKRLQALGHTVEIDPDALTRHQRFAGDDSTRLAAIARAAVSGADVLLTSRGGYGITRLLPHLPYRQLIRAVRAGTRWVGFSDFTALQLALLAQTGGGDGHVVTWAGPALCEGFGAPASTDPKNPVPDDIMLACFDDLVSGAGEGAGWRLPARDLTTLDGKIRLAHDATLWGGNLTMIASMLGTLWWPDQAVQGGVLFLEDVGEHPYRIERMLAQLLHAGVLKRQRAVLLGQFTSYRLTPFDRGYKLAAVVDWLRGQLGGKVPVLTGLPFGHVPTKVLLPVGAKVDLFIQGREALVCWGHAAVGV
ncbi:MAG: LD-carboxypeptidase [Burkholderiaceae bacterium]|nr:LD-carboxypeptidase [Burkholderiaceae bacterium]